MIPDLQDSVGMSLLSEILKARKITEQEYKEFSAHFESLHGRVVECYEREKVLVNQARRVQNDVLGEKIKLERATERLENETKELETLEAERERVQKELDDCEQRDTVNKYELQELMRHFAELMLEKDELIAENEATVLPELKRLTEEVDNLKTESEQQESAYERETKQQAEMMERHDKLETDLEEVKEELKDAKEVLLKAQLEPERIRKQAESVRKAADNLAREIAKYTEKIAASDASLQKQAEKRAEAEEVKTSLARKLDLHNTTIEHRQQDVESLQRNLDKEKGIFHDLKTERMDLELQRKAANESLRREIDALNMSKKEFEQLRRKLRKKRTVCDGVKEVLPTLEAQLVDKQHALRSHQDDNKRLAATIEEAKKEVDVNIARFMKQENIESSKRDALDKLLTSVAEQEAEIVQWNNEERRLNKLTALLSAQRDLKAREATRAAKQEKETRQSLKVKELTILDLTKKCNEVNNRLKEFSALYDVVKNERNKYVNLIQASSQALAEMKEKIKILNNEVEILRNESLAKDKALQKEQSNHQNSKTQRDQHRLDLNKSQQEYRKKQEMVQQQIEEVKTLNSIINGLERDMLRLKRKYEDAVEKRNQTGVSLIDRNDELCILYEKANLQESTLKKGETAVREREEELRALKLELKEVERQLMVTRKQLPQMPQMAEKATKLREQLNEEQKKTEKLCKDLESPENTERWRSLGGEDPDLEQLTAKVSVLEARLHEKKEQLLEKELILEEVTTLTQKYRNRATDGRSDTLKLAQKVNEFQARIRDTTRRMMATVSELSMYQATAMKLQAEKNAKAKDLEEQKWRLAHNQPPSDDAEREWYRLEAQALAKHEARLMGSSNHDPSGVAPAVAVRTTADPRPNAYIPDELGIPKPYGGLAPFKPTELGSSMRHIKAPKPPEIQI